MTTRTSVFLKVKTAISRGKKSVATDLRFARGAYSGRMATGMRGKKTMKRWRLGVALLGMRGEWTLS